MPTKPEIYEIGVKAFPQHMKQAIEWGIGYQKSRPVQRFISQLVAKYYISPEVAIAYLLRLYESATWQGMMTFEEATRNWKERYLSLTQISGVKVSEMNTKTIMPEKDEEKFNSLLYTLFGAINDTAFKESLEKIIPELRKQTKLYRVRVGDKRMILPHQVVKLYKDLYKMNEEDYRDMAEEKPWMTRKEMMTKLQDELTMARYQYLTRHGITMTEMNIGTILDEIERLKLKEQEIKFKKELLKKTKDPDYTKKKVRRKKIIGGLPHVKKKKAS